MPNDHIRAAIAASAAIPWDFLNGPTTSSPDEHEVAIAMQGAYDATIDGSEEFTAKPTEPPELEAMGGAAYDALENQLVTRVKKVNDLLLQLPWWI